LALLTGVAGRACAFQELEEVPMTIVGGFDVHRAQITFDYLLIETGEVRTGQIAPANRLVLRRWLRQFAAEDVAFAVEGCTGWRFVAEELLRAGHVVHLAEPADTATLRGRKKRAKTDRADARHLRQLLMQDRLPESWVPPVQVLEVRAKARLYVALMDERRAWQQRIHAQLFHQGVPAPGRNLLSLEGRERLAKAALSPAGRQIVEVGLSAIDHLTGLILPLRDELRAFAPRQPGCRALMGVYGIGPLIAPIVWAELGDTRRFSSSEKAVRYTGLDITVWSSDGKRHGSGHLSRQGPPALRWALFEAAYMAARTSSPDHAYYLQVRDRQGSNRAALSVARKLARRAHHILRDLGDQAWAT
jgi:transposase